MPVRYIDEEGQLKGLLPATPPFYRLAWQSWRKLKEASTACAQSTSRSHPSGVSELNPEPEANPGLTPAPGQVPYRTLHTGLAPDAFEEAPVNRSAMLGTMLPLCGDENTEPLTVPLRLPGWTILIGISCDGCYARPNFPRIAIGNGCVCRCRSRRCGCWCGAR